jgi:DNA-binding response OmpR family regulator
MQDLETVLQDALEDRITDTRCVLVPRSAVVKLRDKLRSERHTEETADSIFSECERLIFAALWAKKGRIVSRDTLLQSASLSSYNAMRVHVNRMREKMAHRLPELIIDVHKGRGYVLREVRRGQHP